MTENSENANAEAATKTEGEMPVEANLLQFFSGMAMQTLMHLGLMSNPITNKMEQDLVQAKYSIDILGVLEKKTKGNLNDEEEGYLTAMLSELRMQYVNTISKPQEPETAEKAEESETAEKTEESDAGEEKAGEEKA